ncbi:LysR family transcriptional regulator [Solihabitans fulvus]|uniref:LysR family transcriptional regulator n=1 Tax=Solihabitans fulvus TaxID=1892852 RepID=UPI001661EA14|nr:LysR family transcriptional regulator [Solihabitans fulvus]
MDFGLHQLRTFREVARTGSFTKAARSLGYSQSSVTCHVRALESKFGTPFFERLPNGVRLTQAGETFHTYVMQMFSVVDDMVAAVSPEGDAAGRVTVGVSPALVDHHLGHLVRQNRRIRPGLRVAPRTLSSADVIAAVRAEEIDLGFVLTSAHRDDRGGGTPDLAASVLCELDFVPVVGARSDDGRPFGQPRVGLETGWAQQVLVFDPTCVSQRGLPELLRARFEAPPDVVEAGSVEGVRESVSLGFGVGMLPAHVVAARPDPNLVVVSSLPKARWSVTMLWSKKTRMTPAVEALLDVAQFAFVPEVDIPAPPGPSLPALL